MSSSYIVGLDIGSSSIKAAVAEVKKNKTLSLIQTFKMPSAGLRRGVVDDLQEATRAVSQVLGEIKKISNNAIKNIFLGVGSPDFKTQASKGMAAVVRADSEINQDDIDRATENAQAIKLPGNRSVVHYVTQQYVIDDMGDVKEPLGMVGNRLEVLSLIIHAFGPNVKNLTKCVESAGGGVAGLIFSPLAASRAILSKNQKELGTVLVDIGFGKTGISVYEESKLLHTAVFPIGSGHVTNDLAIRLKVSVPSAENIKLTLAGTEYRICGVGQKIAIRSELLGPQFVASALAAFAVGQNFLIQSLQIKKSLEKIKPMSGRMRIIAGKKKCILIDDTYNASPVSVKAALDVLSEIKYTGRKVAILGNMNELGQFEAEEHRLIGEYSRNKADLIVFVGKNAHLMAKANGQVENILTFDNRQELIKPLNTIIKSDDLILIKASQNNNFFEEVTKQLLKNPAEASELLVRQSKKWMKKK